MKFSSTPKIQKQEEDKPKKQIETINFLRAISAIGVCWYHFIHGNLCNTNTFSVEWICETSGYGQVGVQVFFVISSFVTAWSLFRSNYHLKNFLKFVGKRLIRIYPPYLSSIAVVLLLDYLISLISLYQGDPPNVSLFQVLSHLIFSNLQLGYADLNPVYWTLEIIVQGYIFVGLLFPLLTHSNSWTRWIAFFLFAGAGVVISSPIVLGYWSFVYALGLLVFYWKAEFIKRQVIFHSIAIVLTIFCWVGIGAPEAISSIATAYAIAFIQIEGPIWTWLGSISYSLYLFHVPIGGRIVNIGHRFMSGDLSNIIVAVIALVGSIVAADLLYRCIEHPARSWVSSIKYDRVSPENVKCSVKK